MGTGVGTTDFAETRHDEIEHTQRLLRPPDAEWRAHEMKSHVRHRRSGPKGRQTKAQQPLSVFRFVMVSMGAGTGATDIAENLKNHFVRTQNRSISVVKPSR